MDFKLWLEATSKVYVQRVPGKGRGLFATKDIQPGEIISAEYATEIDDEDWQLIMGSELERLYGLKWGDEHTIIFGNIPFQFSNPLEWERFKQTKLYSRRAKRMGESLMLGAFNFINHSNNPNAREEFDKSNYSVKMIATKLIPKGAEITKRYNKAGREAIARIVH